MAQSLQTPSDNARRRSANYIHRLPPEILHHIFQFTVDSDLDPCGFAIPSGTTSPLILTKVCSPWRRLAISYPRLWASVSLVARGSSSANLNKKIVDLFIRRSGDALPFSFALNYDRPIETVRTTKLSVDNLDDTRYVDNVKDIASCLISIRHRWRRLVINVLVLEALEPFFLLLSEHEETGTGMPILEELSISTKYTEFYGPRLTLPLNSCSQLRTVRILTPMVFCDPSHPKLEQLTTLDLHFCSSQQEALAWLSCCTNLENLSIDFFASTNDGRVATGAERRIRLPRLTYFSLTCFYGELGVEMLLESLELPSLCAFAFIRCGLVLESLHDRAWRSVVNLLTGRSQEPPPLRGVRLINAPSTSSELKEFLESAGKGITYLALGGNACTDTLLEDFNPMTAATNSESGSGVELAVRQLEPLCPKLEALELLDANVSLPSIASLASSRAARSTDPTKTSLSGRNTSEPESEPSFRTLKRLALLRDNFSQYFSDQESDAPVPPLKSHFPDGLDVFLL